MKFFINRALLDTRNMPVINDVTYFQKDCTSNSGFLFGTIANMNTCDLQKNFYNLKVSDYLAPMRKYCLNYKGSYFKQVCQLNECDVGKFIKSNSGCKIWTGDILTHESFTYIKEHLPSDEMMFIAPYKKILEEYRFCISNDQIVTYSHYSWDKTYDYKKVPENVIDFVDSWKDEWSPDWAYTVDVGVARYLNDDNVMNREIGIVEYNCLSTSGLYNANIEKLIDVLRKELN